MRLFTLPSLTSWLIITVDFRGVQTQKVGLTNHPHVEGSRSEASTAPVTPAPNRVLESATEPRCSQRALRDPAVAVRLENAGSSARFNARFAKHPTSRARILDQLTPYCNGFIPLPAI